MAHSPTMTNQPQRAQEGLTFSCNHVTDDDPCPARVLFEQAYQTNDLYGYMRFHHGWHAALACEPDTD